MNESDEDYRYQPDDFDENGELSSEGIDPAPLVILSTLGLGAGLVLAGPLVDPITVSETEIELPLVAMAVFALGLLVGGGVYARRGNRRLGSIHIVGALGWLLFVAGTALSNATALVVGIGVLVASTVSLIVLAWYSP